MGLTGTQYAYKRMFEIVGAFVVFSLLSIYFLGVNLSRFRVYITNRTDQTDQIDPNLPI